MRRSPPAGLAPRAVVRAAVARCRRRSRAAPAVARADAPRDGRADGGRVARRERPRRRGRHHGVRQRAARQATPASIRKAELPEDVRRDLPKIVDQRLELLRRRGEPDGHDQRPGLPRRRLARRRPACSRRSTGARPCSPSAAGATKSRSEIVMLVVCPNCAAANRLARRARGDDPVCGKCGTAILDGKPVDARRRALRPLRRDAATCRSSSTSGPRGAVRAWRWRRSSSRRRAS